MHGRAAFFLSWGALVYSIHLTALGHQSGFTTWWAWVRGAPPPLRTHAPRDAYRHLRHPVYLSFLGLIWLTPVVSFDRAVLIGVWTTYVFLGSVFKDRRLAAAIGVPYRAYQARVPGYPVVGVGPLARVPLKEPPAGSTG